MAEVEKVFDPETATLDELRAAALAEAEAAENPPAEEVVAKAAEVVPEAQDHIDNSEEVEEETEPEEFIVRREIDLGDGSGTQVFTGKGASESEAYEALTDKLVSAQTNATRKIHELNKRVKVEDTRTEQQKSDEEYVIQQRYATEPGKVTRELVRSEIAEIAAREARSLEVQRDFVNTHPLFSTDPTTGNGDRLRDEFLRLNPNATEFTEDGLEKAYKSLSRSGLLVLRAEEADAVTEAEVKATARIETPKTEATQPRVQKKSSTVRSTGRAPVAKIELSEDDLYKMDLGKLRKLADDQLSKAGQE